MALPEAPFAVWQQESPSGTRAHGSDRRPKPPPSPFGLPPGGHLIQEQVLVGARLNAFAVQDDGDAVRPLRCGHAVGHKEGRAVLHDLLQGLVHVRLGLGVEGGGGLVEHEDAGVHDQGPGNGNALLLPPA